MVRSSASVASTIDQNGPSFTWYNKMADRKNVFSVFTVESNEEFGILPRKHYRVAEPQTGKVRINPGDKFCRLTVVREAAAENRPHRGHNKFFRRFECVCECGNTTTVYMQSLRAGSTKSCGCWGRETGFKHGFEKLPELHIWRLILYRCGVRAGSKVLSRYVERGICEEWAQSFEAFYSHVGPRPSSAYSIDRIDNEKGYFPGNVRWSTRKEQARNKSETLWVQFRGGRIKLADLRDLYPHIPRQTIWNRFKAGKTDEDLIAPPWKTKIKKS